MKSVKPVAKPGPLSYGEARGAARRSENEKEERVAVNQTELRAALQDTSARLAQLRGSL
jgi:hypothetical protein